MWQQQSLILHLFVRPDPTASASTPDTSSKTIAHVRAAATYCRWDIAVTYFIFDPNPRRAEKQLLARSAMKTTSALIDSGSVHKKKLSRGHNLAMFHVSLYCIEHQASTRSFHLRWLLPPPQPRMIKRWQCQPRIISHREDKNIAKIPLPPWKRKRSKHKRCSFSHSLRKQHWKPAL